ncbi:MAG: hypothetical protein ABJL67_16875 [Sulfitobacter sp.]
MLQQLFARGLPALQVFRIGQQLFWDPARSQELPKCCDGAPAAFLLLLLLLLPV